MNQPASEPATWQFLTNHTHVLLAIQRNPDARQRDIAGEVGITEGAVQRIVAELESAGCLSHERVGRRNHYSIERNAGLRHPMEAQHNLGELLEFLDE